jgi:hypothetical protein
MIKSLVRSLVVVLFILAIPAHAHDIDISGKVAFVSLTTAKVVREGEPLDEFAPRVLLRFTREDDSSTFLTMTGADGTAFIPIEAGHYCVEAFGLDGHLAKMFTGAPEGLHRCFTAVAGRTVEFSVTLAADAKYGGSVPPLGIQ